MSTLSKKVKISGVGIHSGLPVNMVIKPSLGPGIFFKRIDMKGSDLIPATFDNVGETFMRNTTIGDKKGAHVQTVEHLMATFFLFINIIASARFIADFPSRNGPAGNKKPLPNPIASSKTRTEISLLIPEF